MRLLSGIPGCSPVPGIAKFSAVTPGTHITPHCGFGNFKLRCHLGLTDAPGCEMRVGSEIRRWEDGKCMVFDDSLQHEVWNKGDRTRIVLLFDFWHPDLAPGEVAVLKDFFALFNRLHVLAGWKRSQMTMKPAVDEPNWWV
jgi:aspartate beta-hydroxylase